MEQTDWFLVKYLLTTVSMIGFLTLGNIVKDLMDELEEKSRKIRIDMPLSSNLLIVLWAVVGGIYLFGCPYLLVKMLGF